MVKTAIAIPDVKTSGTADVVESYGVVTMERVKHDSISEAVDIAKGGKGFAEQFFAAIAEHRNWDRELDGISAMVAY